ncbi:MAG TPA: flagellar motor switch protein FliG [Syntrophales bacterium]|nr:flagellar motor switch protein FliG [Syntrophales bacterium]HOM07613.1 flagellar motor switch protein FliG [Syntrophales bacterium]HON99433.1 flagellar motor switch protein FliG [Syntrophales bacterium]HPC00531.1 flagellar motor switch protein FliG [Syntrophales bacterium]HPQ06702.1 flagellar motor switch protein FliG [Syntrophales bacterium]
MTNEEKAAIMLLTLDVDVAAEVMKNLRPQEIRRVGKYMNRITTIPDDVIKSVARDFLTLAKEAGGTIAVQDGVAKHIVMKALGEKNAQQILDDVDKVRGGDNPIVDKLRDIDPKVLMEFTKSEHPQTIALILVHLKPDQAAEILENFGIEMQCEIVRRMATLKSVPHEFIEEIAKTLEKEIASGGVSDLQVGGVKVTSEILNRLGRTVETAIMDALEERDPELANTIRSLMFTFDDVLKLDDRSLQEILKEVSGEELAKALKLTDETMRQKIYRNMSRRGAEMLKEDLEMMPPIRVSEVEACQRAILEIAKRLEAEGRIVISRGGEEDELV